MQGHYAERGRDAPDRRRPKAAFDRLASRDATTELFTYDAGHAFFNDENLIGTYSPDDAAQAWERATRFLSEHVK